MSIILTQHNLVVAFPLHREEVHPFMAVPGRPDPSEVLMPKGVTMASRKATNAFIHAGGSPTVRVASTRMLYCFDELKSML